MCRLPLKVDGVQISSEITSISEPKISEAFICSPVYLPFGSTNTRVLSRDPAQQTDRLCHHLRLDQQSTANFSPRTIPATMSRNHVSNTTLSLGSTGEPATPKGKKMGEREKRDLRKKHGCAPLLCCRLKPRCMTLNCSARK